MMSWLADWTPRIGMTFFGFILATGYIGQKPVTFDPQSELEGYILLSVVIAIWCLWIVGGVKKIRARHKGN